MRPRLTSQSHVGPSGAPAPPSQHSVQGQTPALSSLSPLVQRRVLLGVASSRPPHPICPSRRPTHTYTLVSSGVIQPEPNDPSGEALESDKNSMPFSRQCHRSFHIRTSPCTTLTILQMYFSNLCTFLYVPLSPTS